VAKTISVWLTVGLWSKTGLSVVAAAILAALNHKAMLKAIRFIYGLL
jgi:hypothetical protein